MDHRLGTFEPLPPMAAALHRALLASGRGASRLRRVLGTTRSRTLPDLLEVLTPTDADWTWVNAVHEVMREHSRARELALLQCARDASGAWTGVAVLDELQRANVRRGDAVLGGFAILRDAHGLAVYPRVYRQVCANGAVAARVIAVDVRTEGVSTEDAIRTCLSGAPFDAAVARFRAAAALQVDDDLRLLARAGLTRDPGEVLAAREDRDPTVWGLVNALTALARRAPGLPERVGLERQVENLLQAAGITSGAITRGAGVLV